MKLNGFIWNDAIYQQFFQYLQQLGEENYRAFSQRIIPNTPFIMGIRIPQLRKIAKEIQKGDNESFLKCSIGKYHEERLIEGFILCGKKVKYEETLSDMHYFSKRIYNWAICDSCSFVNLKKYLKDFIKDVESMIHSSNPWEQRMAFGALMSFCLSDELIDQVIEYAASVDSDFYYVQMMQAWLIATAAVKYRESVLDFLEQKRFNPITQKMAIQKIRDSKRISKDDKKLISRYEKR